MRPRFVGRLGLADAVTTANAVVGFLATAAAGAGEIRLAARLLLLAAVADGLDGIVARRRGGTALGHHLDALADVSSFAVAPAALVVAAVHGRRAFDAPLPWIAVAVASLFVAAAVVRLAMYAAYDGATRTTEGVPTTLAATVVGAGALAGFSGPTVLVGGLGVLAALMVTTVRYPDLHTRDALLMGAVQGGAVIVPAAFGGLFPRALLALALAYLLLAPRFYWRDGG